MKDLLNHIDQAVISAFRKSLIFSGRANRSEFWYWQLFFHFFIWLILKLFLALHAFFGMYALLPVVFYLLVTLPPSVSLMVRRLHDINRSGWYVIIMFFPLMVIYFFDSVFTSLIVVLIDMAWVQALLSFFDQYLLVFLAVVPTTSLFLAAWWLYWMTSKGDEGENRFGPPSTFGA